MKSKHKNAAKKPTAKHQIKPKEKKRHRKSFLIKLVSAIETNFKKKMEKKRFRSPRKKSRKDLFRKKIRMIENALRKRRMKKLESKRQKARRKRCRRNINKKKLFIYQDKDFHKGTESNLHPYPFPDLLKKSYHRKIRVIKVKAPPISEKLDEIIVQEISSSEALPFLDNLTVLSEDLKLKKFESEGFYKVPNLNASQFELLLKSNMSKNQTGQEFKIENNYLVISIAQDDIPHPNEKGKQKKIPNQKKNQKHVRFSDVVAVLEPRPPTPHHPVIIVSEEEHDTDSYEEYNDYQLFSNTTFDSTNKSNTITTITNIETESSSSLPRTRLDGKAVDNKGLSGKEPVSILKDEASKFISSKIVLYDRPGKMRRPGWYKGGASSKKIKDIVKMDFINIIRTYITLSKLKEFDHHNLLNLVGDQCSIKGKERKYSEKDSTERKKRGIYKHLYHKYVTDDCKERHIQPCRDRTIINIKGIDELFPVSSRIPAGSDANIASYVSIQPKGDNKWEQTDSRFNGKYFLNERASSMAGSNRLLLDRIKGIIEKMVRKYIDIRNRLRQERIQKIIRWKEKIIEEEEKKLSKAKVEVKLPIMNEMSEEMTSDPSISRQVGFFIMTNEIIIKKPSIEKLTDNLFETSEDETYPSLGKSEDLWLNEQELNRHLWITKSSINDEYAKNIPSHEPYYFSPNDESDKELASYGESVSEEMDETILFVETIQPPIRTVVEPLNITKPSHEAIPVAVKDPIRHQKQSEKIDKTKGKVNKKKSPIKMTAEQASLIEKERKRIVRRRGRRVRIRLLHRGTYEPPFGSPSDPSCIKSAGDTVRRPIFDEFNNRIEFHSHPPKVANNTRRLGLQLLSKLTNSEMPCSVSNY